MQISLKWLKELINIESINLEYLIEKLTLGGFEVEDIIEIGPKSQNQLALDISATANRSDSLSIQGISAEVSTLISEPIIITKYSNKEFDWNGKINNLFTDVPSEKNCPIFVAVKVENLTSFASPKWLKEKLINSGITPKNNLSDFQNYILLETGYPFAFYDFEKICSKLKREKFTLTINTKCRNEDFIANNNLDYKLDNSILSVNANDLPISVAGIIEDENFSCSDDTTSILIEASIFNSAKIRQQSRKLGLRTDRSSRYEKSLKKVYLIESLYRLISLLRIKNRNLTCKLHTNIQTFELESKPIFLQHRTINEILGPIKNIHQNNTTYITSDIITNYLTRLNFNFECSNSEFNTTWKVSIPHSRNEDITREIDLVEEIGRLHGFDNFLALLPKIREIGQKDLSYQTRQKITSCLLNLGFTEFIHYSLVYNKQTLNNNIKLINPSAIDYSNLRISLLPSLVKTVRENLKQGSSIIEGFEYGHVFSGNIKNDFKEEEKIAGIFGGIKPKLTWSKSELSITWLEAKGKIEQLFKELNLRTNWRVFNSHINNEILHPYRSSEIYLSNGNFLGTFGQINPISAKKMNIPLNLYLFEFDFKTIENQMYFNKLVIYRQYSAYPKIIKDLSLIVKQNISFDELKKIIYSNGTKFLSEINLIDEYRGDSIPDNSTSLCLQLIFQSNEKTLQNKEVDNIVEKLQILLSKKFNITIRN